MTSTILDCPLSTMQLVRLELCLESEFSFCKRLILHIFNNYLLRKLSIVLIFKAYKSIDVLNQSVLLPK